MCFLNNQIVFEWIQYFWLLLVSILVWTSYTKDSPASNHQTDQQANVSSGKENLTQTKKAKKKNKNTNREGDRRDWMTSKTGPEGEKLQRQYWIPINFKRDNKLEIASFESRFKFLYLPKGWGTSRYIHTPIISLFCHGTKKQIEAFTSC